MKPAEESEYQWVLKCVCSNWTCFVKKMWCCCILFNTWREEQSYLSLSMLCQQRCSYSKDFQDFLIQCSFNALLRLLGIHLSCPRSIVLDMLRTSSPFSKPWQRRKSQRQNVLIVNMSVSFTFAFCQVQPDNRVCVSAANGAELTDPAGSLTAGQATYLLSRNHSFRPKYI